MNFFVYYYFLGRKYGKKPNEAAKWAIEWVQWWDDMDNELIPHRRAPQ